MNGNPLKSVGGVTGLPVPSVYDYSQNDVSKPDAGRTEDGTMHKEKIGTCVKLELSWQNVSLDKGKTILSAFQNEYLSVEYFDGVTGSYKTATFYVGDRSAKMYSFKLGIWSSISFNLIERTPK